MGTIKTTFSNNIDATGKLKEGSLGFSAGTSWQAVKTTNFTAVAGEGYFVDTTSGAITVTLPSSPTAGDAVVLKDYARTWATNAVTIASALIDGTSTTATFNTNGQTVTLVYMDGTKGWSLVNEDTTSDLGPRFISATGGTVTTSGDYKIHTFTGDGCFVVSEVGNPAGSVSVDYLVVAGGAGGGSEYGGGGGGAGGLRFYASPDIACYPGSPLKATCAITVSATTYPITVGSGGAGGTGTPSPVSPSNIGANGSNSVFSTITSAGGGGGTGGGAGNGGAPVFTGLNGGSGGGGNGASCGGSSFPGGTGNTPPTSPSQGNNGGSGIHLSGFFVNGGGGGGAMAAGANTPPTTVGPNYGPDSSQGGIGAGFPTAFVGSNGDPSGCYQYFSGGGNGGTRYGSACNSKPSPAIFQVPSIGGGGYGGYHRSPATTAGAGDTNTGGGGGGGGSCASPSSGGAGGSGIVILRYKYQ